MPGTLNTERLMLKAELRLTGPSLVLVSRKPGDLTIWFVPPDASSSVQQGRLGAVIGRLSARVVTLRVLGLLNTEVPTDRFCADLQLRWTPAQQRVGIIANNRLKVVISPL